jgi:DNA topoisomerase-1
MPKPLVIVESPAKAKTLARFLGNKYRVEASYGHVRDLPESAGEVPDEIRGKPWGRLGVDVDGEFTPYYVVPADKKRHIQSLKGALKEASEVLLATDPDREGESISWHLLKVLRPKVPVRRIVFHEITEEAVREALNSTQSVDENLVRAQESRRILDRLYGYTLSPVLWKKVQTGLSAGRVQSVAVRLIVEREEERRAFKTSVYWDLEARLRGADREFGATLVQIGDDRLATGKDFDSSGQLKTSARVLDERDGTAFVSALQSNLPWKVTSIEEKPVTQRPAAPFTTSTLQQEANRKLGFSSERTMQIAQRLFQGVEIGGGEIEGLITYHRTDSTTLSQKALTEAARVIVNMFGDQYYAGARQYQTKVRNAQEAHEAIRPTDFRQSPQQLEHVLDADELRLYELVWKRTIASQMADARLLRTTLEITGAGPNGEPCVFTASGKAIEFAGFLRAYVEGSDDPAAELGEQETLLPQCRVGDLVVAVGQTAETAPLALMALDPKRHETAPPARYTEASLVKALEEDGIGRPSTYAPTIATIQRRGYVFRQGKALVPSFSAFAVTKLLKEHFGDYVDIGFTAEMEEELDEISNGERDWLDFVRTFYRGSDEDGDGFRRGLEPAVQGAQDRIEYPSIEIGSDPETGAPIRVRLGRYGPFLQFGEGGPGNTASLPDKIAPADLTVDKAMDVLRAKAEGPKVLGTDPKTGQNVYVTRGRFGAYAQLGENPEKGDKPPQRAGKRATPALGVPAKAEKPRRASLPAGKTEETITLEEALKLLSLPRLLGRHPESQQDVTAALGRFGPYVKHGDEFRSLEEEDDVHTIGLERALQLLAAPKKMRRRMSTKVVLRQIGTNAGGKSINVMEGRYGPYVTDGSVNASIPKGTDPASVTIEQANEWLEARAAAGPVKRGRRPRAMAAEKSVTRKAASRKRGLA